ncbi:hypothetical protein ABG889_02335, partial [Bifidobacterium longum]
ALSTELLGQRRFIVHGRTPSRIMFAWQLAQAIRQPEQATWRNPTSGHGPVFRASLVRTALAHGEKTLKDKPYTVQWQIARKAK